MATPVRSYGSGRPPLRVIHQKFRTAVGKLPWMAQLRDDLKYPKNLTHLLKYVNQTRDFVFVTEPQLPVRSQQGKFPSQIVYSDSAWPGSQKVKEVNDWFVSFSIQCQSLVNQQISSRKHQLLLPQQKVNCMLRLKQQ